jgi:ribosomal protein S18 acetylase RimI-like enzyme
MNHTIASMADTRALDIQQIGSMLARAFYEDPVNAWVIPDDLQRQQRLPVLLGTIARYGAMYGRVDTLGEHAAAIWLPPDATEMPIRRMLRAGLVQLGLTLGPGGTRRILAYSAYTEAVQARILPDPHWYLFTLGVEPTHQRQGLGAKVLYPVLDQADHDGVPCYLETSNPDNLRFYQRQGFTVVAEDYVPNGPHFWAMRRQPRA